MTDTRDGRLRARIDRVDSLLSQCSLYGPADALRENWRLLQVELETVLREAAIPPAPPSDEDRVTALQAERDSAQEAYEELCLPVLELSKLGAATHEELVAYLTNLVAEARHD